jgi:curli biogenesis system outer membrane secretion channel CsgG
MRALIFDLAKVKVGIYMRELLIKFMPKVLVSIVFIFFLISCSTIDQAIHPDDKSPTWPPYDQVLKENYKGPKARIVVINFADKSARNREMSQLGDGMAEMLRNALLATNRYIIQVRKSLDDVTRSPGVADSDRIKKEGETDLLVEGIIKEFKHGISGAGDESGGASSVTLMVTVTNPRTNQVLDTRRIRGRAADFGEGAGKSGTPLSEVFKTFSKTPMEKAIRIAIEESASFIVAKTPPDSYRVLPMIPPPEPPKPPPVKVQPEVAPPPAPAPPPKPILRVTQVVWANVNLREGPGTNYKVVGNAKKGTSLKIIEVKGDWLHVLLENGSEAWVSKLATSEAPTSSPSPPPPKPTPM